MCGTVEHTRTKEKQKFINKIERVKKQSAKVCIECEYNNEGYCAKHKGWCSKVNYICNGESISYQEKLQNDRFTYRLKKMKQEKKKLEQRKIKKKAKNKVRKKSKNNQRLN